MFLDYGVFKYSHLMQKPMKQIYFGLFLSLVITGCSYKSKVSANLAYSTLNDVILCDSIAARIICGKFEQASVPSDIQKQFFANDGEFVQDQIKGSLNLSVDTGRLFYYSRKKKA